VDGDQPGDVYVTRLTALSRPPSLIVQLPSNWTIEDVVTWMLEPGAAVAIPALSTLLPGFAFTSLNQLRDLLKTTNNRGANTVGLKEDVLAHENIAGVLDSIPACRARVVAFCEALVCAANGVPHSQIVADNTRSSGSVRVVRFAQ